MHQPRQVHLLRLSAQLASLSIALGHLALCDVPRNPVVRRGAGVKNRRMHEVKLSDGIITLSPLRLGDVEAHLAGRTICSFAGSTAVPGRARASKRTSGTAGNSGTPPGHPRFRHPGGRRMRHSQGLSTCGSQEKAWLPAR